MLGEVVDDEEENNNNSSGEHNNYSLGENEVLINNIKCEVCKNIPVDICTCESCNKYYYKKCTQNLTYCVECEFCHDYFLEKDLTEHKCKVPHYICKCCKKYVTINEKEFWDHLITNHKEEFVKELDLNN